MSQEAISELDIQIPESKLLKPNIVILGIGGAGCNAVNNMIDSKLSGVHFVVTNTDSQSLNFAQCPNKIQLGANATKGLGAGSSPELGKISAEESIDEIKKILEGSNMLFITAGMGGGTGTGASPVVAKVAKELNILTIAVITKPFDFEGKKRMHTAEEGIKELQKHVDTLVVIPNQNLFRIVDEKTSLQNAFKIADDILYSGVRSITDLITMPGLINLDFADIKTIMQESGSAMMGTGEASGENRAIQAAEAAITNPLLDNSFMTGAKGVLINITGGADMTLYEVDTSANRVVSEINNESVHIIFGSTFDAELEGKLRVSVVATGMKKFLDAKEEFSKSSLSTKATFRDEQEIGLKLNNFHDQNFKTPGNINQKFTYDQEKSFPYTENKENSSAQVENYANSKNIEIDKGNVIFENLEQQNPPSSFDTDSDGNNQSSNYDNIKDNFDKIKLGYQYNSSHNQLLYDENEKIHNIQSEQAGVFQDTNIEKPSFFRRLFSKSKKPHKQDLSLSSNYNKSKIHHDEELNSYNNDRNIQEFPEFFDKNAKN
ncbi:MAG: cell division protein FtsZ [Rickettsia sp.]|nr:cell division protein FtsZ [Rickettsia sp.]